MPYDSTRTIIGSVYSVPCKLSSILAHTSRTTMGALTPSANRELERFGVKIFGSFLFLAPVFYCRALVNS